MYYNNILETIGNTPLVKLNKTVESVSATVLAKIETTNPGNSVKDRMALKMIEDAEKRGDLKPGGTIIECTSGNTGMGLAIAAVVKGYHCIFTTTDKQSKEKVDMLKAVGAGSYHLSYECRIRRSSLLLLGGRAFEQGGSNSYWCNQYDNLSNRTAHYETTGPEIWEQTEGKVTHFVVGVGTGGTISGIGKYLKEKNPAIKIYGIDTYGSVFKKYHETGIFDENEIYPYITEGIGEDILPKNVDFDIIDLFEKVTDKDAAISTRQLAKEEGILVGNSAGSALAGVLQLKDHFKPEDVVVVLFHDHASRYMGKIFNDEWMRERGFLDTELRVKDIIAKKNSKKFVSVESNASVRTALELMKSGDISQMPVVANGEIVGAITERNVLQFILENPFHNGEKTVSEVMGEAFPTVSTELTSSKLIRIINKQTPAVLAKDKAGSLHIVTEYDILQCL